MFRKIPKFPVIRNNKFNHVVSRNLKNAPNCHGLFPSILQRGITQAWGPACKNSTQINANRLLVDKGPCYDKILDKVKLNLSCQLLFLNPIFNVCDKRANAVGKFQTNRKKGAKISYNTGGKYRKFLINRHINHFSTDGILRSSKATKDDPCQSKKKRKKPKKALGGPCPFIKEECLKGGKKAKGKKSSCKITSDPCKIGGGSKKGHCKKAVPCKKKSDKKSSCSSKKSKSDPCAKKKSDPCIKKAAKKKTDPCATKKSDPCAKQASKEKSDPCATSKKSDPCSKQASKEKSDPCATTKKSDPCAKKASKKKSDPCATTKKSDPCAKQASKKKSDPCAPKKMSASCVRKAAKGKSDPCVSKASKKSDPCAKRKSDPCIKKAKKSDPCAPKAKKKSDPCGGGKGKKSGDQRPICPPRDDSCKKPPGPYAFKGNTASSGKMKCKTKHPCQPPPKREGDPCKPQPQQKQKQKQKDPCEQRGTDPCKPKKPSCK